jgi:hypothetical protein
MVPVNGHLNAEQRTAVRNILHAPVMHVPYVLFGPPGTGKTMTLVECIVQAVRLSHNKCSLLVCAPSNAAADVVAMRLAKILTQQELMRVCGASRSWREVPELLQDFCNWDRDLEVFYTPIPDVLARYNVIVCTCMMGGKLHNTGVQRGAFDFIMIDEAGQATEPETLCPISALLGPNGRVGSETGVYGVYMCSFVCVCLCVYVNVCVFVCLCLCVYVRMCIYVYIYVYIFEAHAMYAYLFSTLHICTSI